MEFEDLIIANALGKQDGKREIQDLPEVFESAIHLTLRGIEHTRTSS